VPPDRLALVRSQARAPGRGGTRRSRGPASRGSRRGHPGRARDRQTISRARTIRLRVGWRSEGSGEAGMRRGDSQCAPFASRRSSGSAPACGRRGPVVPIASRCRPPGRNRGTNGYRQATHATRVRRKAAQARRAGARKRANGRCTHRESPLVAIGRDVARAGKTSARAIRRAAHGQPGGREHARPLDGAGDDRQADSARSSRPTSARCFVHDERAKVLVPAVCDAQSLRERDAAVRLEARRGQRGFGRLGVVDDLAAPG